jgi:predicted HTH domain antitoxin
VCYIWVVMQVTVEMPDQVARQWGKTPKAVGRRILEDAAVEGYRAGRLSQRQVGAMLGFDYWQTETFLTERGVPLNYSSVDLASDNATLSKILPRS